MCPDHAATATTPSVALLQIRSERYTAVSSVVAGRRSTGWCTSPTAVYRQALLGCFFRSVFGGRAYRHIPVMQTGTCLNMSVWWLSTSTVHPTHNSAALQPDIPARTTSSLPRRPRDAQDVRALLHPFARVHGIRPLSAASTASFDLLPQSLLLAVRAAAHRQRVLCKDHPANSEQNSICIRAPTPFIFPAVSPSTAKRAVLFWLLLYCCTALSRRPLLFWRCVLCERWECLLCVCLFNYRYRYSTAVCSSDLMPLRLHRVFRSILFFSLTGRGPHDTEPVK